jgi:hypothetical protein
MNDLIKQNLNNESYIQTLIERISNQRNDAFNSISILETELLKASSINSSLTEENKKLKEEIEQKNLLSK